MSPPCLARILGSLVVLGACVVRPARLQAEPDWSSWRHSQSITLPGRGVVRFVVPQETIDSARPDLADLRLLDDQGWERPYALVGRPAAALPARSRATPRTEVTSGSTTLEFEIDPALGLVESITLDITESSFFKAATAEGSDNGTTWSLWVIRGPVYRSAAGATQLVLRGSAPGAWRHWRLRIDELDAAPVPIPFLTVQQSPPEEATSGESVFSPALRREESGTQTRLAFRLPAASLPLRRLTLGSSTSLFERSIRLVVAEYHQGELDEKTLATAHVSRVPGAGGMVGESLDVVRDFLSEHRELTLVIENGDSPPLENLALQGSGWLPHLVAELSQPGDWRLLSGNEAAAPPRYDLQALEGRLRPAAVTGIAGPLETRAEAGGAPNSAPVAQGIALDLSPWGARKRISWEAAPSGSGVTTVEIPLDAEVMARGTNDLRDLRVVRGGGQFPSVLDRTPRFAGLDPEVELQPPGKDPSLATWRISLPVAGLPLARLTCRTEAPLFDRDVILYEKAHDHRGPYRRVLARQRWIRLPDRPAALLSLSIDARLTGRECFLEMDHGDNPALELEAFRIWHPTRHLLFQTSSKGSANGEVWQLYYANDSAQAPRYDLALAAPRLLQAVRTTATAGPEEALRPAASRLGGTAGAGPWFWLGLAVMVGALLFTLARMLPKSSGEEGAG